jgi:hypothetical protein
MVNKIMASYVLLALVETTTIIATFDLWMSQRGFDTFAFVVNYTNKK